MTWRRKSKATRGKAGERSEPTTVTGQLPLPRLERFSRSRWTNAWAFRRHVGYYVGLGGWHCELCGETFEAILSVKPCRAGWGFRTDVWWGSAPTGPRLGGLEVDWVA